jgi:hypothetical protein
MTPTTATDGFQAVPGVVKPQNPHGEKGQNAIDGLRFQVPRHQKTPIPKIV